MNREIKFRGKRVDNGEWEYGYLVKSIRNFYNDGMSIQLLKTETNKHTECVKIDEETIGQYIGLKDKDNVEIFDGDIVEVILKGQFEIDYEEVYIVVWDSNKLAFKFKDEDDNLWTITETDIKIISNIHN